MIDGTKMTEKGAGEGGRNRQWVMFNFMFVNT